MSKTDKVGEVLHDLSLNCHYCGICRDDCGGIKEKSCKEFIQARHALLEVIKTELPKIKHPLCNFIHPPGQEMCVECYSGCEQDYNQALTEVNAILERLFLGKEK